MVLGLVHLAATPHIPGLLNGSPGRVYQRAVGPTLLNHVLVGILLFPLGYTTFLAARDSGQVWARRVLAINALTVLTLPISVAVFMRQPEYYTAPLFLTGVGLVAIISFLMLGAAFLIGKREP